VSAVSVGVIVGREVERGVGGGGSRSGGGGAVKEAGVFQTAKRSQTARFEALSY
jgi:hypothetical protein